MATKNTKKKTARKADLSPLYALVGVADYAMSQARETADQAQTRISTELRPSTVQARVTKAATDVRTQITDLLAQLGELPTTAQGQLNSFQADVESGYDEFVVRGEKVVEELRNQPAAKRLAAAADEAEANAKSAVRKARKTADDAQARAQKTADEVQARALKTADEAQARTIAGVQAGRKQAAKTVAQFAGTVEDAASSVESEANTAARSAAAKEGAANSSARKATAKKAPAKKAAVKKTPAKKATSTK